MRVNLTLPALALIAATSANAAQITFNMPEYANGVSFISITKDGVTLSFSNPTGNSEQHPEGTFRFDVAGLCVVGSGHAFCGQRSFDMSFDTPVKLLSYNLGFLTSDGNPSLTYAPAQATGWTDSFAGLSPGYAINFSNQAILGANEVVAVTNTLTGGPVLVQFSAITVDTDVPPVPLPGAVWGMIAGLGVLGVAARRRKSA